MGEKWPNCKVIGDIAAIGEDLSTAEFLLNAETIEVEDGFIAGRAWPARYRVVVKKFKMENSSRPLRVRFSTCQVLGLKTSPG